MRLWLLMPLILRLGPLLTLRRTSRNSAFAARGIISRSRSRRISEATANGSFVLHPDAEGPTPCATAQPQGVKSETGQRSGLRRAYNALHELEKRFHLPFEAWSEVFVQVKDAGALRR